MLSPDLTRLTSLDQAKSRPACLTSHRQAVPNQDLPHLACLARATLVQPRTDRLGHTCTTLPGLASPRLPGDATPNLPFLANPSQPRDYKPYDACLAKPRLNTPCLALPSQISPRLPCLASPGRTRPRHARLAPRLSSPALLGLATTVLPCDATPALLRDADACRAKASATQPALPRPYLDRPAQAATRRATSRRAMPA